MKTISITNPFGAPVYYVETASSTMDISRVLEAEGAGHGTVISAGFQEKGRGRGNRLWEARPGENLFFTVLLRYPSFAAFPKALTLKSGLALSAAIEDFAPELSGRVMVKWPNDVMIHSKKAAGILTEASGNAAHIGIGVNVLQTEFPEALKNKATSIALAREGGAPENPSGRMSASDPPLLLERILGRLYRELEESPDAGDWRPRLEKKLYRRGGRVRFISGGAGSDRAVEGILEGVGPDGELLIVPDGEGRPVSFVTGELDVY
jgi:BirA family biotin operon repressor/biotin-[acetyl-CoA-carboxylase] ligase